MYYKLEYINEFENSRNIVGEFFKSGLLKINLYIGFQNGWATAKFQDIFQF